MHDIFWSLLVVFLMFAHSNNNIKNLSKLKKLFFRWFVYQAIIKILLIVILSLAPFINNNTYLMQEDSSVSQRNSNNERYLLKHPQPVKRGAEDIFGDQVSQQSKKQANKFPQLNSDQDISESSNINVEEKDQNNVKEQLVQQKQEIDPNEGIIVNSKQQQKIEQKKQEDSQIPVAENILHQAQPKAKKLQDYQVQALPICAPKGDGGVQDQLYEYRKRMQSLYGRKKSQGNVQDQYDVEPNSQHFHQQEVKQQMHQQDNIKNQKYCLEQGQQGFKKFSKKQQNYYGECKQIHHQNQIQENVKDIKNNPAFREQLQSINHKKLKQGESIHFNVDQLKFMQQSIIQQVMLQMRQQMKQERMERMQFQENLIRNFKECVKQAIQQKMDAYQNQNFKQIQALKNLLLKVIDHNQTSKIRGDNLQKKVNSLLKRQN